MQFPFPVIDSIFPEIWIPCCNHVGMVPERVLKPHGMAVSEDKPLSLSVDSDAFLFPCNKQREGASALDPGIADIIKKLFGSSFLDKVNEYAAGEATGLKK